MADLIKFSLNTKSSVREEYVRWTEVMDAITDITSTPMTEDQNWAFLVSNLRPDPREYVR